MLDKTSTSPFHVFPRIVIQDDSGERFVLFAQGRAHWLEERNWRDLRWIEEMCSGCVPEWNEILCDDEGAVEILARRECQECGGVGKLPIHRGWCRGNELTPDELISGWQKCSDCGGHGELYDYQSPKRSAYLADLMTPESCRRVAK